MAWSVGVCVWVSILACVWHSGIACGIHKVRLSSCKVKNHAIPSHPIAGQAAKQPPEVTYLSKVVVMSPHVFFQATAIDEMK